MSQDRQSPTPPLPGGWQGPGEEPPLSSVEDAEGGAPGPRSYFAVNRVLDAVNALDVDAIVDLTEPDALTAWALLEEAHRVLAGIRSQVMHDVAEHMSGTEVTVEGVGTFTRKARAARTAWDKDFLLRAVLDSRQVNTATGEIEDESPLDKVLKVWNLPAPRTTVLKQRGIDPEDYCTTEWLGYTIERI